MSIKSEKNKKEISDQKGEEILPYRRVSNSIHPQSFASNVAFNKKRYSWNLAILSSFCN